MDRSRESKTGLIPSAAFLTAKQLATRWGVAEHRLYRMRRDGEGPAFLDRRLCAVRYALDVVVAYEASHSFKSTAEFLRADRKRQSVVAAERATLARRRPAALASASAQIEKPKLGRKPKRQSEKEKDRARVRDAAQDDDKDTTPEDK